MWSRNAWCTKKIKTKSQWYDEGKEST
jgi:hypothetical protein